MIELAQSFQELDVLVTQQEPAVTQIEQKGEEVTENTAKANTEIDGAIVKARSRNRKKWWCLLIACEFRFPPTLPTSVIDNPISSDHHHHHCHRRRRWRCRHQQQQELRAFRPIFSKVVSHDRFHQKSLVNTTVRLRRCLFLYNFSALIVYDWMGLLSRPQSTSVCVSWMLLQPTAAD